jgi:hypothetical protein
VETGHDDVPALTRSDLVDLVMVLVSVALLASFAGLVWAMERL